MVFILKTLAFVLASVPRPVALFIGRKLGRLAYRVDARHRKTALDNITLAYGGELSPVEKERIARESFENLGVIFFDFVRIPWLTKGKLQRFVEVRGLDNLDRALEKDKGVVLLTAHYGNWEMLGASMGLVGRPMDVVVRKLDDPVAGEFVDWVRTRCGNTMVHKERAMRRLLKALSTNRLVCILLDQNVAKKEGVFVDFFGTPACTNRGPAMLAVTSGAAVVPAFIRRDGPGYVLTVRPEVELVKTGDRAADAQENTRRMTGVIEEVVRERPEQWFWVHRRWKTRPED